MSVVTMNSRSAAADRSARRLIDVETPRAIFTWVQQRLVEAGLLKGKSVAIDATTLEANAAMRRIVRRELSGVSDRVRHGLGDHSNQTMVAPDAVGLRSYIAEPDRGRHDWSEVSDAQAPVYGNRRRMHGRRGRRLMRRTLRGHGWSTHATDHVRRQLVSNSDFRHGLLEYRMACIDSLETRR